MGEDSERVEVLGPEVEPVETPEQLERRLEHLAWFLDSSVKIPGTSMSIGFDSLVGLVPGFGDVVGATMAAYIVLKARKLGASRMTLARMLGNVGLELVVGSIPLVGDVFDMAFKANQRNMRLLRRSRRSS